MTREEAKEMAEGMPHLAGLVNVWDSLNSSEWKGLDVIMDSGKVGIGNPEALAETKKLLLGLLEKQIEQAKANPPKWRLRHFWEHN